MLFKNYDYKEIYDYYYDLISKYIPIFYCSDTANNLEGLPISNQETVSYRYNAGRISHSRTAEQLCYPYTLKFEIYRDGCKQIEVSIFHCFDKLKFNSDDELIEFITSGKLTEYYNTCFDFFSKFKLQLENCKTALSLIKL